MPWTLLPLFESCRRGNFLKGQERSNGLQFLSYISGAAGWWIQYYYVPDQDFLPLLHEGNNFSKEGKQSVIGLAKAPQGSYDRYTCKMKEKIVFVNYPPSLVERNNISFGDDLTQLWS